MARSAATADQLPRAEPDPATKRRRRKVWVLTIIALVAIVGALAAIKAAQIGALIKGGKEFMLPPEAVAVTKAETAEWPRTRTAVGSVVAVRGANLGAELPGVVREIAFDPGARVEKGQVLIRLDTSAEQAQLAGAVADAAFAKASLERTRALFKLEAASQADLDAAEARGKQSVAAQAAIRAAIAKKTIRAPFSGRVGITDLELGQLVAPATPIVSMHTVDPMFAEFELPSQALSEVTLGQPVQVRVDVFKDETWEGKVTTVNPEVDAETRTVRVRATVPNPDGRLIPGMFANIELELGQQPDLLIIPLTAVVFAPFGDSVFVVEEGKDAKGNPATVARQKFVRVGERRGDFVAISSGLGPGETVVTGGAFKLKSGATVKVTESGPGPARLKPTPDES